MAKEAGLRGGGAGASTSPGGEAAKSPRAAISTTAAAADSAAAGTMDAGSRVETSEGLHVRDENPGGGRVEGGKSGVGAAKTASGPLDDEVSVPSVLILGKEGGGSIFGWRYSLLPT